MVEKEQDDDGDDKDYGNDDDKNYGDDNDDGEFWSDADDGSDDGRLMRLDE